MTEGQTLELVERIISHQRMRPGTEFTVETSYYAAPVNGDPAVELEIRGTCSDGEWGLISSEDLKP